VFVFGRGYDEDYLTLYEQNWWFITDQITSSLCILSRTRCCEFCSSFQLLTCVVRGLLDLIMPPPLLRLPRGALWPLRSFQTTARSSDFHFDTHHFVQRLEREGLKREQAEGIMSAMAEVIDESIRNMTSNMVTKADQEKVCCIPVCPSNC
jgi:hypothetical protein